MTFTFIIMYERIHSSFLWHYVVFSTLCMNSDLIFHVFTVFLYIDIHIDMVKGRISP